jgi:predicted XRE-type DNA-binding protein
VHAPDPIPPLKSALAGAVVDALDGWSQEYAAAFLWTDQPRMSDLRNGRLSRFSLEQLIRFASRIGGDVSVTVTWTPRKRFIRARVALRALDE